MLEHLHSALFFILSHVQPTNGMMVQLMALLGDLVLASRLNKARQISYQFRDYLGISRLSLKTGKLGPSWKEAMESRFCILAKKST